MGEQIDFLSAVLRVTATRAGERVRGLSEVHGADAVPASVNQITPDWITSTVGADVPGAVALAVNLREGSDGTSSRRGLGVVWNEAGTAGGLPSTLYTKSTPSLLNRLLIGVTGAAGAEA